MKITIEVPHALMKQVRIRAARDGRKIEDAVADLLRKGLTIAADAEPVAEAPVITRDKETGLPVIQCQQAAPEEEMTAGRVNNILLAQEVEWHHAPGR